MWGVAIVSILISDSDVAIQQTRFGDWIDSICFHFDFDLHNCDWICNFVPVMSLPTKIPVAPPVNSGESLVGVSSASPGERCGLGHHFGGGSPAKRLRVVSCGSNCRAGTRTVVGGELEDTDSETEPVASCVWNRLRKGLKSDMSLAAPVVNSSSPDGEGSSCAFVGTSLARSPSGSPHRAFAESSARSLVKPRKRAMRVCPGGRTFPGDLARQIIAGIDCPRCDDPSMSCADGIGAGRSTARNPVATAMSRNARKKQRSRARKEGGLLILRDHPSRYRATHNQVGNLIAKCLPRHCAPEFRKHFECSVGKFTKEMESKRHALETCAPSDAGDGDVPIGVVHDDDVVIKTPVKIIDSTLGKVFGSDFVSVTACYNHEDIYRVTNESAYSDLDIVVLDCILSRKTKAHKVKRKLDRKLVDTPVKMMAYKAQTPPESLNLLSNVHDEDEYYRACVVILPEAGVYFCHRERRKESAGLVGTHIPMDINWLRLNQHSTSTPGNWFSDGSYVLRMCDDHRPKAWKWSIRRSAINFQPPGYQIRSLPPRDFPNLVFHARQCTDEDGPCLPPDFIDGKDCSHWGMRRRIHAFRARYFNSPSARRGCRHYARAMLHKKIDPHVTWVIEPSRLMAEVDLHITVHIPYKDGKAALHRTSVLKIRFLPEVIGESNCTPLLEAIHDHCSQVKSGKRGGARAGKGDNGVMVPIGCHIERDGRKSRYVASSHESEIPKLRKAVTAAFKLASVTVPGVVRVAQDLEDDAGVSRLPGFEGENRKCARKTGDGVSPRFCFLSHTMDLSINLANASHYDVWDASQGFSIWTEDYPGSTRNWYFVLPNLRGYFPDSTREYRGVAIKLTHGVLISWDGRLIRHCTSICERKGDVCGSFFAAKTRVVKFGMKQAQHGLQPTPVPVHADVAPVDVDTNVTVDMNGDDISIDDASEDEDDGIDDEDSVDSGISIPLESLHLFGSFPLEGSDGEDDFFFDEGSIC